MTRKLIIATLVACGIAAAAPSLATAASPVQVTGFSVTPSCVTPGGTVTADVTVRNTTYLPQAFYAQDWVSVFGYTLQRSGVAGPYGLPPDYSTSQTETASVPSDTPWGYYTVNVGVGPSSSSPTSWSQASTGLTVSPFC